MKIETSTDFEGSAAVFSTPAFNRTPAFNSQPRVALIHYWLVGMRGGEKVIESLCRMFPQADIFTHVYRPDKVSDLIRGHKVMTTSINRLPMAARMYQKYLPFMPAALEEIDLSGYDLVISSEAGPAKGVITGLDTLHLCYCHSPMRYIWDQYNVYRDNAGPLARALMPSMARKMRAWDTMTATRPDHIMANSHHVSRRVAKYWRRVSDVVHPPVSVENFAPAGLKDRGGFYLWAGELAPYKRPDIAIEAFSRMNKPLFVIGGPGKTERALAKKAGESIRFLGRVDDGLMRRYLAACRALIFPGEEDFGIIPVEAMAAGRPVIAYGRGGALDTVADGRTGILFKEQSVNGVIEAVERFEASGLEHADPQTFVSHAATFSEAAFTNNVQRVLAANGMPVAIGEQAAAAA